MVDQPTLGRRLFDTLNYALLISLAVLCILPLVHVLAISLSSSAAVAAGKVGLWPVDFTLSAYLYVLKKAEFVHSLTVTYKRVLIGVTINMLLTVLMAYPLSKDALVFRWRTFYVWVCVITMLFSGGLIPLYMTVKYTGIMDSIWALVLPGAVPVFNVILLLNFFRNLPKEIEEAAVIDGASYWKLLWKIYVPLSLPAMATITLFAIVGHWNSWFDGIIFMNSPDNYPLQSYLRTVVIEVDMELRNIRDFEALSDISDRTTKAAQIFLAAIPILVIYPFLQKFFMKGIVIGGVKG